MADGPQGVLPGFEPEPVPSDRLFFALLPDAAAQLPIAAVAAQLRQAHGCKGRVLPAERLHVTLNFLGDHAGMPQAVVDAAMAAASAVRAAPLDVLLDTAQSFYRRRKALLVLVAGGDSGRRTHGDGDAGVHGAPVGNDDSAATGANAALHDLHRQLAEALAAHGVRRCTDTFTPHVTVLYDDLVIAPSPVEPVRWVATDFVLVHSLIGKSRHTVLGRWPVQQ